MKEKQIDKQAVEEMAKNLADAWIVDLEGNPHDLSEVLMFSDIYNIAEQLCEQSYRKQSVGEWVISSDGYYPYCSKCRNEPKNGVMTDYCPNCGAKMKGGAEG